MKKLLSITLMICVCCACIVGVILCSGCKEIAEAKGENMPTFTEYKLAEEATNTINGISAYELSEPVPIDYTDCFTYTTTATAATITGLTAKGETFEHLETPATYNEVPVTSIAARAFRANLTIRSFIIPDTFSGTIGGSAFYNCTNLTTVRIGSGVTSIGDHIFTGCANLNIVTLDNLTYSISEFMFADCTSLETIILPNTTRYIYNSAFKNCIALKSIIIPNTLREISGTYAFENCTSFNKIIIPQSVTSIGSYVFRGWTENQTIYCRAESQPAGWSANWNNNCNAQIVWGYTGN